MRRETTPGRGAVRRVGTAALLYIYDAIVREPRSPIYVDEFSSFVETAFGREMTNTALSIEKTCSSWTYGGRRTGGVAPVARQPGSLSGERSMESRRLSPLTALRRGRKPEPAQARLHVGIGVRLRPRFRFGVSGTRIKLRMEEDRPPSGWLK